MEATVAMGFWSPRRFGQLLFRELASGYRGLLVAMAAVGGSLLVISALTALGIVVAGSSGAAGAAGAGAAGVAAAGSGAFYAGFFNNLLILGGCIVTSLAFREMWHNGGGIFYLTIPGSIFEKLTSKLLVTSVGYAVGSTIFFTAAAALSEGLVRLVFGVGHGFFNPFTPAMLRQIVFYLCGQSVFLLGSIWFRKGAFIRTILWIMLFAVAAGIVAAVTLRIGLAGHFEWRAVQAGHIQVGGWSMNLSQDRLLQIFAPGTRAYGGLMVFKTIGQVIAWLLAPVAWVAAYFRLGEAEV